MNMSYKHAYIVMSLLCDNGLLYKISVNAVIMIINVTMKVTDPFGHIM